MKNISIRAHSIAIQVWRAARNEPKMPSFALLLAIAAQMGLNASKKPKRKRK